MIWVFFITPKTEIFWAYKHKTKSQNTNFPNLCYLFSPQKNTQNPNLSKLGKRVGNDCPSFPCIAYSHGFYEQNPKEHRLMMGWQERGILLGILFDPNYMEMQRERKTEKRRSSLVQQALVT